MVHLHFARKTAIIASLCSPMMMLALSILLLILSALGALLFSFFCVSTTLSVFRACSFAMMSLILFRSVSDSEIPMLKNLKMPSHSLTQFDLSVLVRDLELSKPTAQFLKNRIY